MTGNEIKLECEKHYLEIQNANDRLKELREICKHEETFEGKYSWRIGSIIPAKICSFCNKPIKLDWGFPIIINNNESEPTP